VGRSSHQQPGESAPQLKAAPHRPQFLSVGKARQSPTEEGHLLAEIGAAVANKEMQTQRQAFGQAEVAVQALGYQACRLFAGEHHSRRSVGGDEIPLREVYAAGS
jgi:hypothetical protein